MKFSVLALITVMSFGIATPAQAQRLSLEVGGGGIKVGFPTRREYHPGYRESQRYYPYHRRVRSDCDQGIRVYHPRNSTRRVQGVRVNEPSYPERRVRGVRVYHPQRSIRRVHYFY